MNVPPTLPATAPAPSAGAPSAASDVPLFDAPPGTFGDLLWLATAPAPLPPLAPPPTSGPAPESPNDPIDWTLPFVAPTAPPAPVPLDFELGGPEFAPTGRMIRGGDLPQESLAGTGLDDLPAGLLDGPSSPVRLETAAQSASSSGHVRSISAPVGEPRWSQQIGHELRLLVDRGVQSATLRLNPEHLGPVEVHIEIAQDKATVVFGASQAETRAALQEAIPKLREMFAAGGLALGDAGVRDDRARAQSHLAPRHEPWDRAEGTTTSGPQSVRVQVGLVDAYA